MSIVPDGSPAWVRSSDHSTYGGDTNKTNWHSQGVTNGRTDVGAEAFCRLAEDLSAVMRTAPFCTLTIQCDDDGAPGAPTITAVNQMTGVRIVSYLGSTPPTGFPSADRNGNGDITITWESSYVDDYGVSGDVNIQHVEVGCCGTVPQIPVYSLEDNDSNGLFEAVRVRVFDAVTGAASVSPKLTVSVVTGTAA